MTTIIERAAHVNGIKRYFYTPSACIYPEFKQMDANLTPLKEDDAYPAFPQDAYGWIETQLKSMKGSQGAVIGVSNRRPRKMT